jgi:hypothetical protein
MLKPNIEKKNKEELRRAEKEKQKYQTEASNI